MKKKIALLIIVTSLITCQKNDLKNDFNCKTSTSNSELKEYRDILKKFKIKIPTSWKTSLYYDEYQSKVYTADTTKSLTDTYILDIAWHQGELNLNEAFAQTVKDTLLIKEQLNVVKSKFSKFQNKPCYWTLSEGNTAKYAYSNLQVYIKTEVDEYFTVTTKVYGDKNVDERLCKAIELSSNIVFIQ